MWIAVSVDELLAEAERVETFVPARARSTATFERVRIDGEPCIVKYLHADDDFAMRAYGDLGSRTVAAYKAGLFDAAPSAIDHTVVGMARGTGRNGWGCAVLMRDVSERLATVDDSPFDADEHASHLDHLAQLCAATWGWHDDLGLLPYATRWQLTSPLVLEAEFDAGSPERIVPLISDGWTRFAEQLPADLADAVHDLRRDSTPLARGLGETPSCFLHGDWKASNLGLGADGRTILLDWVYLGEGPACHDLGWYLCLNRQKLPTSKEQAIEDFRAALEHHGVDTAGWWERQVALSLLGTFVQFGWEKALGAADDDDERGGRGRGDGNDELGWWCDRARDGLAWL